MSGKAGQWPPARDVRQRLIALGGLVVIVGAVVLVLFAAGLLGRQSGGVNPAVVLEPPPAPGQPGLAVGPQVGRLAPDFELSDFDGVRHRLSDFRGKPVYLNFWATWCGPCQAELPDVQVLLDRHRDELAVIAVNRGEPRGRARSFLQKLNRADGGRGMSFTVNGLDPDDTLYDTYRGLGMPVSVFIDAGGVVTLVRNGQMRLSEMEQAVAETLASAALPVGERPS